MVDDVLAFAIFLVRFLAQGRNIFRVGLVEVMDYVLDSARDFHAGDRVINLNIPLKIDNVVAGRKTVFAIIKSRRTLVRRMSVSYLLVSNLKSSETYSVRTGDAQKGGEDGTELLHGCPGWWPQIRLPKVEDEKAAWDMDPNRP